ncbi:MULTISPECIES: DUF4202 domain-containing protein [unclassified Modicisalibacter]|uniref:DUF4202 domain-containing protein n=1 Tax=unclassified Modicisalibacter TaxID=2679913 RepID=UPI001CCA911B|nr:MULTISPECIES: DUF4202 domain-containing protein [unclassified Modicisalibacter]MBZ9560367.1 DUF4202 domain-containing protein [Modicisalibacter sp. R2A 31.J]MBZ9576276.1 DUF4202 domain-containing protein [Modicisalibacter sp. MOD 31.J]
MLDTDTRFTRAIARLDALHAEDPRTVRVEGETLPYELHYARCMSAWLDRVLPEASEALRLAVRAQHLQRWQVPRDDYPRDRPGYLTWRRDLGRRQAETAAGILKAVGYDAATGERVASLIRKEGLRRDPETQALEDTACLVFLDNEFAAFAARHDDDKILRILRKTWAKMSPRGHELAMTIDLPEAARALVQRALGAA